MLSPEIQTGGKHTLSLIKTNDGNNVVQDTLM